MRRAQYVSQVAVKDDDTYRLTDREQDQFIHEVAQKMQREMRERVKDARPISDIGFTVTGPHSDPIQGNIHVHTIHAWFDLDQMPADAQFRLDYLATLAEGGPNDRTIQ